MNKIFQTWLHAFDLNYERKRNDYIVHLGRGTHQQDEIIRCRSRVFSYSNGDAKEDIIRQYCNYLSKKDSILTALTA